MSSNSWIFLGFVGIGIPFSVWLAFVVEKMHRPLFDAIMREAAEQRAIKASRKME